MTTPYTTLLLTAFMLASTPVSAQLFGKKAPPAPITLEPSTPRAEAFQQLVDDGAALRHTPKPYAGPVKPVAISSVTVEFITDTGATSTQQQSAMDRRTSSTTVNYKLVGLPIETMQAVADSFAQNLRDAIAEQGYPVVEQEKLMADPAYAALVAEAATAAPQTGNLLTKNGFTRVVSKGSADTSGITGLFKDIALAKALGDVLVVKANIVVNFAQLKAVGSALLAHKSQVDHGVQLSIAPTSTFAVVAEGGAVPYPFLRTTQLPSQIAAEVKDLGMSGGQMATSILTMMATGNRSGTRTYEVTAAEDYGTLATSDLKMFAQVLANGLKKQ